MLVELTIRTGNQAEYVDITAQIQEVVEQSEVQSGMCHLFVPHTTAGITLNENWDPNVRDDALRALERSVPRKADYRHAEGNSAAHIKAMLIGFSTVVPVENGRLTLGTWQGIFLAEFDGPRSRTVLVRVIQDPD